MSSTIIEKFIQSRWKFVPAVLDSTCSIPARFTSVPRDLWHFLSSYQTFCNADETQWFISAADYQNDAAEGFSWNEFETMSLQAADDDQAAIAQIISFWDRHLPVFMRVDGEYAYAAYCLGGENSGCYVAGREPEFEEVSVLGRSLPEFHAWVLRGANT